MTQGTSAVGVGLSGQDNVTVKDNEIETLAGDYASVQTADNLGTANAAILDKDNKNTNLVIWESYVRMVRPIGFALG